MGTGYTIKAYQQRGGWSLVVDGVGVSHVRRLEQAEAEMRAAVSDLLGVPAEEMTFHLDVMLPAEVAHSRPGHSEGWLPLNT